MRGADASTSVGPSGTNGKSLGQHPAAAAGFKRGGSAQKLNHVLDRMTVRADTQQERRVVNLSDVMRLAGERDDSTQQLDAEDGPDAGFEMLGAAKEARGKMKSPRAAKPSANTVHAIEGTQRSGERADLIAGIVPMLEKQEKQLREFSAQLESLAAKGRSSKSDTRKSALSTKRGGTSNSLGKPPQAEALEDCRNMMVSFLQTLLADVQSTLASFASCQNDVSVGMIFRRITGFAGQYATFSRNYTAARRYYEHEPSFAAVCQPCNSTNAFWQSFDAPMVHLTSWIELIELFIEETPPGHEDESALQAAWKKLSAIAEQLRLALLESDQATRLTQLAGSVEGLPQELQLASNAQRNPWIMEGICNVSFGSSSSDSHVVVLLKRTVLFLSPQRTAYKSHATLDGLGLEKGKKSSQFVLVSKETSKKITITPTDLPVSVWHDAISLLLSSAKLSVDTAKAQSGNVSTPSLSPGKDASATLHPGAANNNNNASTTTGSGSSFVASAGSSSSSVHASTGSLTPTSATPTAANVTSGSSSPSSVSRRRELEDAVRLPIAATLPEFVQFVMTADELTSSVASRVFFMSYRVLFTAEEVLDALLKHLRVNPPSRARFVAVVSTWSQFFLERDFIARQPVIDKLSEAVLDSDMLKAVTGYEELERICHLGKGTAGPATGIAPLSHATILLNLFEWNNLPKTFPLQILPPAVGFVCWDHVHPKEAARQMALMEHAIYSRIAYSELSEQNWNKRPELAPNARQMISDFNRMTMWIAHSIVREPEIKMRSLIMSFFIDLGHYSMKLGNYNCAMEVIGALGTSPISRMKKTFATLSTKRTSRLESMRTTMARTLNFSAYRAMLREQRAPCVPYLGIMLQDLVFADEGSSSWTDKDKGTFNFEKLSTQFRILEQIVRFKNVMYAFRPVPELQHFLATASCTMDESQLFQTSLANEPRAE